MNELDEAGRGREPTGDHEPIEVSWHRQGLSIRQVAAKVGMPYGWVRCCLVAHGVPLRSRGGPNNPGSAQVAPRGIDNWPAYYAALSRFVDAHGHPRLPTDYRVDGVGNVYHWLHRQSASTRPGPWLPTAQQR